MIKIECFSHFCCSHSNRSAALAYPLLALAAWHHQSIRLCHTIFALRMTVDCVHWPVISAMMMMVMMMVMVVMYSGEKGSTVLATKPTILVCDLTLPPGDSQTCQWLVTFTFTALID